MQNEPIIPIAARVPPVVKPAIPRAVGGGVVVGLTSKKRSPIPVAQPRQIRVARP